MFLKIILAFIVIVAALVGYAAMQPADYVVSRQITINAPAEKIFPYLNNAKMAEQWAPWIEIDPQAKMSYSGPEAGVGARTSWTDGKQLGTGSATIVESTVNERVHIKLEYVKPMAMTQDSEYLLSSSGGQSTVIWKVQGKKSVPERVMCIFMNMDKMVGGFFEKGLNKLKNLVESQK